jgi:penicillin-binding protein 1A
MAEERRDPGGAGRKPLAVVRPPRPRESFVVRWLRRLAWLTLIGGLLAVGALAAVFSYYGRDLPSVAALRNYRPAQVTRVLDRHGALIDELFTERRTVVPIERVPRVLVLAVLAAEDADFYRHEGLDYPGIVRALARYVMGGRRLQGTSTITQQIVKNLLLTPERSLTRKIKELILARRLEQEFTKDEILGLYLNTINYGHGRYGVQEAARFYFGKDVSELDLAEATLIAGVPQQPARLSPRTHPEAARRRQRFVLDQLEQKRAEYWPDLTLEQIRAARETTPRIATLREDAERAPEIVQLARKELRALVGDAAADAGGYTIHTTLDLDTQRAARAALRAQRAPYEPPPRRNAPRPPPRVARLQTGHTYDAVVTGTDDAAGTVTLDVGGHRAVADVDAARRFNPESLPASRFARRGARVRVSVQRLADDDEPGAAAEARLEPGPEGAVVVIDPRTRDVVAVVGGYESSGAGFNRAMQAVRQPGSTFKPIVYGLALRTRRITPASIVLDAPEVFDQWRPQNYETWRYQGPVRVREAVAQSINLVAVHVMQEVTPASAVTFAQQLGITTPLVPTLALALGASEVRPLELVNAYATFAAGGTWAAPRFLKRIVGPDGRDVPLPALPPPREVMTPAEAYVLTSLLTSVVQSGTATAAKRLARPIAGKTGTSNDARDTWFVGYTPELVAGVWVGYDDRRPLGRRESGAKAALPVWIELMGTALRGRPVVEFPVPSGVMVTRIDPASGLLAWEGMPDALEEVFLEGTQPTEAAQQPGVVDPSTFLMEQLGGTDSNAPTGVSP